MNLMQLKREYERAQREYWHGDPAGPVMIQQRLATYQDAMMRYVSQLSRQRLSQWDETVNEHENTVSENTVSRGAW